MLRSTRWAISKVRTVLQENLEDRLEEGRKLWTDGLDILLPRVGLRKEGGDYYEAALEPEQVERFPAVAIFCREARPLRGSDATTIHQANLITIRFFDSITGKADAGNVEKMAERLDRYEAAAKDLFQFRKTRLQTLAETDGIASGIDWVLSRFPNQPGGMRTAEIDLLVRIHEDKGT